jgi:hypothetical protein
MLRRVQTHGEHLPRYKTQHYWQRLNISSGSHGFGCIGGMLSICLLVPLCFWSTRRIDLINLVVSSQGVAGESGILIEGPLSYIKLALAGLDIKKKQRESFGTS